MALYLQMNGNGDYFKTPSITFNRVEIDAVFRQKTGVLQMYYDFRVGFSFTYLQREANGNDYAPQHTHYVNGVKVGNSGGPFIPSNERIILKAVFNTTGTDDAILFANNGGNGAYMAGDIYSIKFYNETTLVAHYDMSTGTVQDQSGNGNHAILTGGTWVDDGTGEEPPPSGETIDAGDITLTSSSGLTAQANRILTADSDLQADSTLTAFANRILNADSLLSASTSLTAEGEVISLELNVNMSAKSSLSAQGIRIKNGASNLSAESFLTAEGEVLALELSVNMSASSNLSVEANRIVHGNAVLSTQGEVIAQGTAIYNGEAIFIATSELTVISGEPIIGTISLNGGQVLNVYLVGKQVLDVNLKGVIQ